MAMAKTRVTSSRTTSGMRFIPILYGSPSAGPCATAQMSAGSPQGGKSPFSVAPGAIDEFRRPPTSKNGERRRPDGPPPEEDEPMSGVRVAVGTRKGAFILTSDGSRKDWDVDGPHFGGWEIYH